VPAPRFPTLVAALTATLLSLQAVSADTLSQYPYQDMETYVSWHIQQGTFYWFIPTSLNGRYEPESHDWDWGDILGSGFSPAQEASLILGSLIPAAEEGQLAKDYPVTLATYKDKIPLPANEWPEARNNVVKEVLYTQAKDGSWPVGEKEIVGSTACGVIDLNIALRLYEEGKWTPPSQQIVQNIIEAVRKGAVWLVETQNSDGSWPDQPGDKVSSGWYTVAACFALLYTLLNAGYLGLTKADFSLLAQSLDKGVLWLIQNQKPDGAFPANVMGSSLSPDTQAYIIDLLVKVYEYDDQLGLGLDKQKLLDAIKKAVWWLFAYEVPYEQIQFMNPGYSHYKVDQNPDSCGGVVECYQWGPLVWMKVEVTQGPSDMLHKPIGYGPGWAFTYDGLFSQDGGLPETTVTGNVLSHALLELYYFNPGDILDTLKIPVPNPNKTVNVNGSIKYAPTLVPLRKLFDPNFQFNIFATIQWFMNQQWCSTIEKVSWYGGWPWPHMGVAVQAWTAEPCRVSPWATAYVMKALEAFYDMKTFYSLMNPVPPQNSNELTLSKEIIEYLSTALEQRIDKLQQDIEQVKEQLSSQINGLGTQVQYLSGQTQYLNQSVSSIENRLKNDEQELQSLKSELSNLENEVKSNSQGLQSLNQQVSSMNAELKNLEQELSNLKSEVDQLESDVNGLKNTVSELEKDVNDLENTVKNLGSGSQGSSSSGVSSEEVQKLEGEIQTLQDELGKVQQDLKALESTLEALKSEEEKVKGEADANAGEIQALESTVKELEGTVSSLQESLKSLSDEVKGQGSDVEALKEKVGEIEKKVSDLESVVESLSRKVTDLEARVSTGVSPTEFEGYVKEVKVLESKVEALEKEIQELKSEEKSAGGSSGSSAGSTTTSPAPTSTRHGSPVVPIVLVGALGALAALRTRR